MRNNFFQTAPYVSQAMMAIENACNQTSLPETLREWVKLRASQLNGCAFCVDMHTTELMKLGADIRKITAVCVWQDSPFFSPQEKMALLWTEHLTQLTTHHAPDAVYQQVAAQFSPQEMAELTLIIGVINAWNRFGVGFAMEVKA